MDIRKILYNGRWKSLMTMLALILIAPFLFSSSYLLTVLILIGIYSIVTLGLSLLTGYAGQLSLGQAGFFAIGAYTSGILTTAYGVSPWIAIIIAMIVTAIFAYLMGIPTLKLKEYFFSLATMAFNMIVFILIVGMYNFTGGAQGLIGIPKLSVINFPLEGLSYYFLVWSIVFVVTLFSMNIIQSHVGRILRGIHSSEIATSTQGINVAKYKLHIFVISAVFASLAGSLYAHFFNFISPFSFQVSVSIQFLIMLFVGGARSSWGAILGASIMTLLVELIDWIVSSFMNGGGELGLLIYGFMYILVLILMPSGLVSIITKVTDKLKTRFQTLFYKKEEVTIGEEHIGD
ncbi:branched-chain amino acid ABC transporter permease [Paenibacillus validus]|uniref:Branched-chain amino acid ABC transporter permease n=1 Tax=Paenibacillus validus TaxID=44253 RepID=A0A7X3CSE0_9BACL|nr:branched-chain amino acid ABC transporter permease [Paenibacillus validus]MED4602199.1 branched-chain amino acid ABC transporter permease [Paenibacillus validus]MED4607496.1 branched-chain amino acid ABC transporter permease [Paenibacillus validus]MUG69879.1 branched-chain amino acid ABC transporter permease [Paenibacillus validus]